MHFGSLVKEVITKKNISLTDAAAYAGISEEKLGMMLKRDEWTNLEIKQFSVALDYDLGKHLAPWEIKLNAFQGSKDCNFYITYDPSESGDKIEELNIAVRKLCKDLGLECE